MNTSVAILLKNYVEEIKLSSTNPTLKNVTMSVSNIIEPSINGEYMAKLFEYLEERGLCKELVINEMYGFDSDNDKDWVKARHLSQAYEYASCYFEDPYLGIKFGKLFTANSFTIVGFLAISAPNIMSALKSVSCFQGIYSRIGKMVIREEDTIMMCWDSIWPRKLMSRHSVEASITSWLKVGLTMVNKGFQVTSITFQHSLMGNIEVYEELLGCPVYFDQAYDAICLDKNSDLSERVTNSDDLVHEALLEKSRQVLATFGHEPLIDKIEAILSQKGAGTILSIEAAAEELSIKPTDVRQQLKKSNLSYRTLVDRAKLLECLPYLLDNTVEIVDIAQTLGFSEQSSFTRAFKRWTDMSPLAYRSLLLANT